MTDIEKLSEEERVTQAVYLSLTGGSWYNVNVYELVINPLGQHPIRLVRSGDVLYLRPLSELYRAFAQDAKIESITFDLHLKEDNGVEIITSRFEGEIRRNGDIKGTFETRSRIAPRMTVNAHVEGFSMSIDPEKTEVTRCECGCAGPGAPLADDCELRERLLQTFQVKKSDGRLTKSANKEAAGATSP